MFPLPFTVSALLLLLAVTISKLQYRASHISIAAHALLGPLETGALINTLVIYLANNYENMTVLILLVVALSLVGLFNFFGFAIQTPFMVEDRHFLKWLRRRQARFDMHFNRYWFYLITLLSLASSFKLKYLLFSGLFNFDCLKCKLQSVQKFKIFNVFSFLCLVPEIIAFYCAIVTIFSIDSAESFFLTLLDMIIIVCLNMLLSVLAAKKDREFFKEQLEGVTINKVFNAPEESFQSSIAIGGRSNLRSSLEDILQLDEFAYRTTYRETKGINDRQKQVQDKISEYTQEDNTVTTSKHSQGRQGNGVTQNREEDIRESQNILLIEDVYDFDEELPLPPEENHETQYIREVAEAQKGLQMPTIQQHQYSPKADSDLQEQENQLSSRREQVEKTERINLAEYLMTVEQGQKRVPFQEQRYDKVLAQANLGENGIEKNNYSLIQGLSTIPHKKFTIDQETNRDLQSSPQTVETKIAYAPRSISPSNLNQFVQKSSSNQKSQHQKELGDMIKRVVNSQNFTKKNAALFKEENREKELRKNRMLSGRDIRINEDHGEAPIKNKSKDKISIYQNSPIQNRTPNHPIKNQRAVPGADDQYQLSRNYYERKKVERKIKTQGVPYSSAIQSGKQFSKAHVQLQYRQRSHPVPSQGQQVNEENLFGFNQLQDSTKQFKRSKHQILTLFPQQIQQNAKLYEHPLGDSVPRKPTSIFQLSFQNRKSKSVENMRSISTQGKEGERRKRSKKVHVGESKLRSEDRRKMRSLEKIYLQNQIKG